MMSRQTLPVRADVLKADADTGRLCRFSAENLNNLSLVFFTLNDAKKPGDAILLRLPDGKLCLIDSGRMTAEPPFLDYLKGMGIRHIDILIASHLHGDHIGGFPDIIRTLGVDRAYLPGIVQDGEIADEFLGALREGGAAVTDVTRGDVLDLGGGVRLDILSPSQEDQTGEALIDPPAHVLNDLSMVFRLCYGKFSALFTGDVTFLRERELVGRYGGGLSSTLLKVAHHGAITSSRTAFMDAASPQMSVILRDFAPNLDTYARVRDKTRGETYLTGVSGAICVETDGQSVSVLTEREHRPDAILSGAKIQQPPEWMLQYEDWDKL